MLKSNGWKVHFVVFGCTIKMSINFRYHTNLAFIVARLRTDVKWSGL